MPLAGAVNVSVLADEINLGFWQWKDIADPSEDPFRRYWENTNSGNPTTISVNISGLQADSQALAILALGVWQDVANITFTYTTGAADITYTETGSNDARCNSTTFYDALTNRLFLTDSDINISRNWSGGPAGGIWSYYFQTLVHETGHALGLGHSGNYNGGATNSFYNTNSTLYANDTWQWSVMSYNDQAQYGGATADNVISPQMADIYAIQATYGAATTRTGNTIYGHNSNLGNFYNFSFYGGAPAFTIYDSGGSDTLDCSGFNMNQTIDLRAGNWSSIGGQVNNIGIYIGVVVENGIGGGGNDAVIGNDADNVLRGGAGSDTLDGGLGHNTLYGGLGNDFFEVRSAGDVVIEYAGEGIDRYDSYVSIDALPDNVENIVLYGVGDLYAIANGLANAINGTNGTNSLYGLGGNDQIYAYGGSDWIDGGAGKDQMIGGTGDDFYQVDNADDVVIENVNEGTDRVDSYRSWILGANIENLVLYGSADLNGTGNNLANAFNGNLGNNNLRGLGGADIMYGYAGNDMLDGGTGADALNGGTGNDTYSVDNAGDTVIEVAGEGTDTVNTTRSSYKLTDNVENLVYTGAGNFAGTGNAAGNVVTGRNGNDTLKGDSGNDTLLGGNGNDKLTGGTGVDQLTGGLGDDFFIFNGLSGIGDTVADFSSAAAGNNDRFDFENSAFGNLAAGALAATQFQSSTAATALNANIRFFFETDTRILRFDRDGSANGFAATVVATLQTGANMTAGDIFLF